MARVSLFFLLSLCILLSLVATSAAGTRKTAKIYELKKGDFSVKVTNWGGVILSVVLPDSNGKLDDVVLAYDGIGPYLNDTTYFGALVGRVGNRIAGSRFVLNGKPYRLFPNDGKNSLHGGHRGFSDVFWTVKKKVNGETPYITLYYHSFDGEQGFPGDLDVYVTYKLSGKYELSISMEAKPRNKATPVNLVQHTYWNLGGEGSGTILKDKVQIFGSKITPVDKDLIPTGAFKPVKGTPYDFLEPKEVGSEIKNVEGGYDINYVLDSPVDGEGMRKVAVVDCESTGRKLELWADKPGVQFYTGNFLKGDKGKNGHVYPQYGGLCLETQGFPDSVNQPKFPSVIVKPGQVYKHNMVFKFSF
ncbi:aldose 1-epimerase [Iris pallida]|uniref:Aldose 1-epimerase n=1 Tax=Iris pallida TaxID=29817 RepID=A0AAX6F712_IRIPA|nr:aldose 1-epimerase [Iris pallida]KAJ6811953.1 aldose 1-epimerase [Iris pallida]